MRRFCLSLVALALGAAPAAAQMSNMLPQGAGSAMGNMVGGSGMGLPSLSAAPPTNIAGLLQYCVENKFLGGNAQTATATKQSLLDKLTGSTAAPANDSAYTNGAQGLLDTGNGGTYSLAGSGVQTMMTQQLCDQVLSRAQSLL